MEDSHQGPSEKKNQKNIYVHKINSLMRISQDSLLQDEKDISMALSKKKLKKVRSEVDKNAVKLQKNRESAKRARLRKKLYIKLLESRVERLRLTAEEGRRIECQCHMFSQMISKKQSSKRPEKDWQEVEHFMEEEGPQEQGRNNHQEKKESLARMDKHIEEVCQVSMCSSLRNIRELSSQISLEEIIKAEQEGERVQRGEELQDIIKEVLVQTEQLRSIYFDIMNDNQKVKKLVAQCSGQSFQPLPKEMPSEERKLITTDFTSFQNRHKQSQSIFINLTEGQKIMIEGWSFLEQKVNDQQDL